MLILLKLLFYAIVGKAEEIIFEGQEKYFFPLFASIFIFRPKTVSSFLFFFKSETLLSKTGMHVSLISNVLPNFSLRKSTSWSVSSMRSQS